MMRFRALAVLLAVPAPLGAQDWWIETHEDPMTDERSAVVYGGVYVGVNASGHVSYECGPEEDWRVFFARSVQYADYPDSVEIRFDADPVEMVQLGRSPTLGGGSNGSLDGTDAFPAFRQGLMTKRRLLARIDGEVLFRFPDLSKFRRLYLQARAWCAGPP